MTNSECEDKNGAGDGENEETMSQALANTSAASDDVGIDEDSTAARQRVEHK
jgi:hypothetical protein